jgi:hypothetical protein
MRARHTYKPDGASFPQSVFSSKGVVNRIISVHINYDEVEKDSDHCTLTAEVSMPFDFEGQLGYRWKLGPDVVLEQGSLDGSFQDLKKADKKTFTVTVSHFSKQMNRTVGFEVYGVKNTRRIYGDALVASDLEDTFENIVQNVERIKASQ